MRSLARAAVSLGLVSCLAACASKRECYRALPDRLSTEVWRTHEDLSPGSRTISPPELRLLPELRDKDDLGIAVSGGGTLASVAALGQMRALKDLGLVDRARYVTCASGGTWLCGPFEYANPALLPEDADHPHAAQMRRMPQDEYDRVFLGSYLPPDLLHVANLNEAPEGSFVRAVTQVHMRIAELFIGNGSESYARIVSGAFLKPFGLGAPDKSFTWSRSWFDHEIAPHQDGGLTRDDFYFAAPRRPYLIMTEAVTFSDRTTFLDKVGLFLRNLRNPETVPDLKAFYPVESTPLYTGVRPLALARKGRTLFGQSEKSAGGGYVETFAYGSRFEKWEATAGRTRAFVTPTSQSGKLPPALFSLSDAVGDSGAALGAMTGGLADFVNLEPKHWHWPPASDNPKREEQVMPHVDGGSCDNSGVITLLARHTGRIICLSNAIFTIPKNGGRGVIQPWELPTDVTALFGLPGSTALFNIAGEPAANQVLDLELPDGGNALEELAQEVSDRNLSGRPLVVCGEYRTRRNDRFEIEGGRRVRICWVFVGFSRLGDGRAVVNGKGNTAADRWVRTLPGDARELFTTPELIRRNRLKNFPVFSIVKENKYTQQLDALQTNSLAQYTAWCVRQSGGEICRRLGL